ncbi:MAG: RNA-binding protein [Rhodospirillales bacterium]
MNLATAMNQNAAGAARAERAAEPMRRCIATGREAPRRRLLRFALSPDGAVTPDLAGRLPGRGAWVAPSAEAIAAAVRKKLFNRAFSAPAAAPGDLAGLVEKLLVQRMVDALGLARRAGQAVGGAEKAAEVAAAGRARVLLLARDAGADARRRAGRPPDGVALIETLSAEEIGRAFGRDRAVHAAVAAGELGRRLIDDSLRLAGLRPARVDERGSDKA